MGLEQYQELREEGTPFQRFLIILFISSCTLIEFLA